MICSFHRPVKSRENVNRKENFTFVPLKLTCPSPPSQPLWDLFGPPSLLSWRLWGSVTPITLLKLAGVIWLNIKLVVIMPPCAPLTFLSSRGRLLQATEITLQTICALDTIVSSLPFLCEPPSSSASSSSSDHSFPPTYTQSSPSFLLPLSQFPPAKTEHLPETMLPRGRSEAHAAQRPMTSYLPSAPCCPWASRQLGPSWIPSHHQPKPMFQNSLPNNDDNHTVILEGLVWPRLGTMEKRQVPTAPIP